MNNICIIKPDQSKCVLFRKNIIQKFTDTDIILAGANVIPINYQKYTNLPQLNANGFSINFDLKDEIIFNNTIAELLTNKLNNNLNFSILKLEEIEMIEKTRNDILDKYNKEKTNVTYSLKLKQKLCLLDYVLLRYNIDKLLKEIDKILNTNYNKKNIFNEKSYINKQNELIKYKNIILKNYSKTYNEIESDLQKDKIENYQFPETCDTLQEKPTNFFISENKKEFNFDDYYNFCPNDKSYLDIYEWMLLESKKNPTLFNKINISDYSDIILSDELPKKYEEEILKPNINKFNNKLIENVNNLKLVLSTFDDSNSIIIFLKSYIEILKACIDYMTEYENIINKKELILSENLDKGNIINLKNEILLCAKEIQEKSKSFEQHILELFKNNSDKINFNINMLNKNHKNFNQLASLCIENIKLINEIGNDVLNEITEENLLDKPIIIETFGDNFSHISGTLNEAKNIGKGGISLNPF